MLSTLYRIDMERLPWDFLHASDQCAKGWINQCSRHSGVYVALLSSLFEYANTHGSPHDSCYMS